MWIKDIEGSLLNTNFICGMYLHIIDDTPYEVIATMKEPGFNEPVLFTGTEEECKEYMDKLMIDLNGTRQNPIEEEMALAQRDALLGMRK